jgi:hypothetical protein
MGNNRYLGFGSINLNILPESYTINWTKRYTEKFQNKWKMPVEVEKWRVSKNIKHFAALKKALNAEHL